ncbi:protein PHLOEM PROTEIN 2-LIKE A10-like [Pistacia vera]|uniref:protein PHLOEM PROTEIN 2-LIKE A10-like n=1 Tax=Pistacia vera TaxID=55513 RepID=UPI001263100B|nr:protein PHLOEM PROTEIN 2-LIKE A10-like [Pistacia vera]
MDLQLVKKGLDFSRKKKKSLLLLVACSFTSYSIYRAYRLPVVALKKKRILKLLGALFSVAEAVCDSAETIGVVSRELKDFLQSESDQIPNSLKQISEIVSSKEFSGSVVNVTQAVTVGTLRGYKLHSRSDDGSNANSSFMNEVMDKVFTPAGSGFASAIVGSFARNLVMAFYSDAQSVPESHSDSPNSVPRWLDEVCSNDKLRELIGDCVQLFVSTAVSVYLDKTMNINTYDEFFTGLTNPKHEKEVKGMLLAVSNGAVETLVKTSHKVLTSSKPSSQFPLAIQKSSGRNEIVLSARNSFGEIENGGWVGKMSSTVAVPSNRRFVLDMTGRFTFQMVRSFLEILLEKIQDALKRSSDVVCEAVVDSSVEAARYVSAKSSAIATICLTLCLHILDSVWIMVPA